MRVVTKHGLSVLNHRYQSVLIKCLLAGMVFLPHAANADFKDGILTVDQDTVLDKSVPNVKTIAFDDTGSNHFTLDGNQGLRSIYGVVNGNMSITGAGTLKNTRIYIYGNVTGNGNTLSINGDNGVIGSGNHTISGINFKILGNSNLSLNTNTMRGGTLTGSTLSTITQGIFDGVDIDNFFGTAWRAQFKNSGTFSLGKKSAAESMKYGEKVYIYADKTTGYYHGYDNPDAANEFYSNDRLYLRKYGETAGKNNGEWLLEGKAVSLKGGKIEGNLNGGSLRIFDESSWFSGELTNVQIYIEKADYTWNDNIKINPLSTGAEFYIGDFNGSEQRVFNMNADITLSNETSSVAARYVTVNGNRKTITTRTLSVEENSWFNDVTIKFDDNLDVTGGGTLNMANSTLHALKNLTAGNLNTTNSTLSAENSITATNINVNGTLDVDLYATAGDQRFYTNNITGTNGAAVTFRTSGKSSDGIVYFNKKTGSWIEIKDVSLNFSGTNASFASDVYFTNARISTTQRDTAFEFQGIRPAVFRGENTIVADNIKTDIGSALVDKNASLTLKNIDGTGNGSLTGGLELYGHFTGDVKDGQLTLNAGSDWSFSGKLNADSVTAHFTDDDTLDMANLKLTAGSSIEQLTLISSESRLTPRMIVNSDFSVNELLLINNVSSAETAARIAGTGTLKTNKIYPYDNKNEKLTVYFDGINIAALNDNLDFTGLHLGKVAFTNNAISAPNHIGIAADADFNGNSSLTAQTISVHKATINGTLTVNGKLVAGGGITGGTLTVNGRLVAANITDSTLNIVLPSVADPISKGAILLGSASNVNLNLDLKNVKSKNAQQYFVVDEVHYGEYTLSGNYGKWAFSADNSFTSEDWKADKSAYKLTEDLWKNAKGKLWILKVAGGAESAIDDLRTAGIYVSPTEENASKILDLINDNPFADRLTDLLDSGDAGLQKQALREIVPTDAAASAFKSAKSAANAVMNSVSGRLGGGSDISGRSGGDLTVGKSVAWVQGLFNRAKMTGGDGFTSGTTGFAAGVEHNVTDEIKAGFGYAFAATDIKTDRSKTDADTHTGFVYGEYVPDALYVNAMLGYGRSDYDDKAKLSGMKNSYKADTFSARIAAGYDMGLLTPEAALRFTAVRQNAYTDDLGARVSAKNLNTTTAVIGTKAGKDFTAGKYTVSPEMKAALTYDLARPNESRTVTLPDGSSYVAAGEHLKRLGMEIGAKAAVRLTNEVELSVSYDGAFKEHYRDHTGMINVKIDFRPL